MTTQTGAPRYELPPDYEEGWISRGGVNVFRVVHWREDGDYVFRSPEFDVLAAAPTIDQAVGRFVDNAEDLFAYLLELLQQDDATHDEIATTRLLIERFNRVREQLEAEDEERRRRLVNIRFGGRRRLSRGYELSPRQPTTLST